MCVNPCKNGNPCARNAECQAQNHRAVCICPAGLIGDPFTNCFAEDIVVKPECTSDSECSSTTSCINQRCHNPCAERNPCAGNAECRVSQHRPLCYCPLGWGGDPQTQCYKRKRVQLCTYIDSSIFTYSPHVSYANIAECKSDSDCPYDKACYNEKCLNPCTHGPTQCGRGADCLAQNHRAHCVCPLGTQGNPLISCVRGVCQYNEDCRDDEACDRLNRVCRPVCDLDSCALTARCEGRHHQPVCNCQPGTTGNPYVECSGYREQPQCTVDSDCPSQLACINVHCENPCAKSDVCSPQQTCTVLDTLPLRTVMCRCPIDTTTDNAGRCVPVQPDQPGCRIDDECSDSDKCISGTCILACRVEQCGVNAQCLSKSHRAICTCAPGYEGNPHIECSPSKPCLKFNFY